MNDLSDSRRGYGGGYRVPDLSAECYVIIGGTRCARGADHTGEHGARATIPTTTILAAAGSTFDMGAGLVLTIRPRCGSAVRHERDERTMPNGQWGPRVAFSHCKRHGAEPLIADDLAPVR